MAAARPIPGEPQVIGGYGAGRFRVSHILYETSILVFPDRTLEWPVAAFDAISRDSFQPDLFREVLDADPPVELLLLGTGARGHPVPRALREGLRAGGVMLEAMDTGAACRTFNVLAAEDRRVAAALIAIA